MSRTDSTYELPPGKGFSTLDTWVDTETFTVLYDADNDTVAIDLNRIYLRLTREQWNAIHAAITEVVNLRPVTA